MKQSAVHRWSIILLVGITVIWGTTFPLLKDAINTLSPAALISVRFLIAAVVLIPFCRRLNKRLIVDGGILGLLFFVAVVTQLQGLDAIPANRAAFITSLHVILVPILGRFLGKTARVQVWLAAAMAIAGVGMLSWEGGSISWADVWVFGCAATYAVYVLLLEAIAPRQEAINLAMVQLLTVAVLGSVWTVPELVAEWGDIQKNWGALVYLGVIATSVTTWTQAIAQRYVSATETAIIYALEPVFAAVFSFWWLGESLGLRGWLGGGMVILATILSQIKFSRP